MGAKYNSLDELAKKKAIMKGEVKDMENLLRFNNVKESLSVITGGMTDKFLVEKHITNSKGEVSHKTGISLNAESIKDSMIDNAIRLGTVALVTNFAKKNLYHSSWKKKVLGLAIIYGAPILLRKVTSLIEDWQEKEAQQQEDSKDSLI
ncbi:TPA: hypothetical protein L3261_002045 [Elizabethkingia anophelis]|nr:hypothetical protein [Elizabethkingia anophelis]HBN6706580.1 hypothetical protein [Elizabethkingia anophelis]HBN6710612.1 hypothetical protein [Elizabethkingia anophelis]HBN6716022.1 hypothetical protein [Elizabethkingia anophelis]HBN6718936.1 hypothetical protein [Elizabethkingia anophelis]